MVALIDATAVYRRKGILPAVIAVNGVVKLELDPVLRKTIKQN